MAKKQKIQLFEEKKVRTVWDDDKEKWFFCVVDVVEALTESKALNSLKGGDKLSPPLPFIHQEVRKK